MPAIYRHTQTSPLTLLAAVLVGILVVVLLAAGGFAVLGLATGAVTAVVLALFSRQTVVVADAHVHVIMGSGIFERDFPLARVAAVAVVRNRWYWGWGIRYTPRGWLYNVAGLDAVELTLASGKHVRIGTDEPARLHAALLEAQAAG